METMEPATSQEEEKFFPFSKAIGARTIRRAHQAGLVVSGFVILASLASQGYCLFWERLWLGSGPLMKLALNLGMAGAITAVIAAFARREWAEGGVLLAASTITFRTLYEDVTHEMARLGRVSWNRLPGGESDTEVEIRFFFGGTIHQIAYLEEPHALMAALQRQCSVISVEEPGPTMRDSWWSAVAIVAVLLGSFVILPPVVAALVLSTTFFLSCSYVASRSLFQSHIRYRRLNVPVAMLAVLFLVGMGFCLVEMWPSSEATGAGGKPSEEIPRLSLSRGLEPPENLYDELFPRNATVWAFTPHSLASLSAGLPVVWPPAPKPDDETELVTRVRHAIASMPAFPPAPPSYGLKRYGMGMGLNRITARYWYLLARLRASEGDPEHALTIMKGVLLIAQRLECEAADLGMDVAMEAYRIRPLGFRGLLEVVGERNLPRATLDELAGFLETYHTHLMPVHQILAWERANLPSKAISRGPGPFIELEPVERPDQRDLDLVEEYLQTLTDPAIRTLEGYSQDRISFQDAAMRLQEIDTAIARFHPDGHRKGLWESIRTLPQHGIELYFLCSIQYSALFSCHVRDQAIMNGSRIALRLLGFHQETGSWPASLDVLADPARPLPPDPYTGKPMVYRTGDPPFLGCVGEDMKPDSDDDILLTPFLAPSKQ